MKSQRGFTLVEIAIVLVIVGVLLGGVLKGQSLIASAKTNGVIRDMQALQAAVYGFQDRYQALPGNLSNAATVVGNGAVNCTADCNDADIAGAGNISLAFNHMVAAGLIPGPAPASQLTGNMGVILGSPDMPTNPWGGRMFIWTSAAYAGTGAAALGVYTGPAVPSSVLAEIDRKIDDGFPTTGSFRAGFPDVGTATCLDVANNLWLPDGPDCAGTLLF